MISRFFWNYAYGRARYLMALGVVCAAVFFANMWLFPTPYLRINGVDQVELRAKPGDEIPVRVARFDSANGWWLTGGINAVFPIDSGEVVETELVKPMGSEWTWENFARENKIENVTVDGTLVIPQDLPSDGKTVRVHVVGAVNYSTLDSWGRDADIADSLLVTLTDRPHSSATFKIVEQSIQVVSLALALASVSAGTLFLLWGAVIPLSDPDTNRTSAYMRRTPQLLRNLKRLVESKARRLPEGYWKPDVVKLDFSEFDAICQRVMQERTELQIVLNAATLQHDPRHPENLRSDQVDEDVEIHDEKFTRAYRDLTLMLKEKSRWYQFWYRA